MVRHLLWEQGHAGSTPVTLTKLSNQPNQPMKKKTNKADKATNETKQYNVTIVVTYTAYIDAKNDDDASEQASLMGFDEMHIEEEHIEVTKV